MKETGILLPAMALVGWTLAVLLLVPYRRFKAGWAGQVTMDDFKFGQSSRVPDAVSIPNRNLMNLLEMPVLFYVLCVTIYVTRQADTVALVLAWSYFGFRVLHSLVHLSYNNIPHRLALFAVSNFVLVAMWARLLPELVN